MFLYQDCITKVENIFIEVLMHFFLFMISQIPKVLNRPLTSSYTNLTNKWIFLIAY